MSNYDALPNRIQAIYNACSPEEQLVLVQILQELAINGESPTYDNLWLSDFKEIPATISEFITSDRYLGKVTRNGDAIYPAWKQVMSDIFAAGNKYEEVIFTGATRIGKTSTTVTSVGYMLHWLMCLRDPQMFFGKKDVSKFAIAFFNLTKDLAAGVAYREFNDTLKASPWFCLKGDTEVLTTQGYQKIQDIAGKDVEVYSYDGENLQIVHPDDIAVTGYVDELIEIELEDGTVISGTPTHQVMLSDKTYKCLQDIEEGDDILEISQEVSLPVN